MKSKIVPVGNGSLAITNEDFLNGFQAGHLAYMHHRRTHAPFTDEHLTTLMRAKFEIPDETERYSFGFVVGWLATLANKGQEVQS